MAHCSQVPSIASLCLLGFIATFKLMEMVLRHEHSCMKSPHIVEYLADTLRVLDQRIGLRIAAINCSRMWRGKTKQKYSFCE
jgi:hypothetical protein